MPQNVFAVTVNLRNMRILKEGNTRLSQESYHTYVSLKSFLYKCWRRWSLNAVSSPLNHDQPQNGTWTSLKVCTNVGERWILFHDGRLPFHERYYISLTIKFLFLSTDWGFINGEYRVMSAEYRLMSVDNRYNTLSTVVDERLVPVVYEVTFCVGK